MTLWLPLLGVSENPLGGVEVPDDGTDVPTVPLPWWETTSRDLNRNRIEDSLEAHAGPYRGLFVDFDRYPGPGLQAPVLELGLDIRFVDGGIDTVLTGPAAWSQVTALSRLPHVVFVEEEKLYHPVLDVSVPAIKVKPSAAYSPVAWDDDLDGTGVNIAIMDTGVDDQHDFLDGSYIAGRDFYDIFDNGDGSANPDDNHGHGTHVASTALGDDPDDEYDGVAPGARLVDVKMMTDVGQGGYILQALNWTLDHKDDDWENDGPANNGIQVASLSVGDGSNSDGTDAISMKANELVENGIVVVAAVGNDGLQQISAPAAGDWVIAVADMDDQDTISRDDDIINQDASNRGPRADDGDGDDWDELKPDIAAPGTDIVAAQAVIGSQGSGSSGTTSMTGTSMATPHMAGLVALLLEGEPELKPSPGQNPIQTRLRNMAEPWGEVSFPDLSDRYNNWSGHGYADGYNIVHSEAPDGVIVKAWTEPFEAVEGDTVSLRTTVRNIGNLALDSARVRFYDGGEAGGEQVGSVLVGEVAPDGEVTVAWDWEAPDLGNHTLEAVLAEGQPAERSTRNNNRTFYLEVNEPPLDPDLRVENIYLSDPEPTEGQPLTVTAVISNVGQEASSSARVSIYQGDPDDGGVRLGRQDIGALEPEAQLEVAAPWDGPDEGRYRLFTRITDVEPLDANDNNDQIFITVDVAAKPMDPDLTISPVDITWDPALPEAGQEVELQVRVHNIGEADGTGRVTLNLDGSKLERWTNVEVPGEDHTGLTAFWTATSGEHELQVVIDRVDNEADSDNNEALTLMTVAAGGTDYQIVKLEVPGRIVEGQQAILTAVVRNIGDSDGSLVRANYYIDGTLEGYRERSDLEAGRSAYLDLTWTPAPGFHLLKVILDSDEDVNPSNDEQTLQLEVLFPLELVFEPPYQTARPGELVLFQLELDNLGQQTLSGTVTASAPALEDLMFEPSGTDTVTFDIPSLSSDYIDLEVMVPQDMDPGNFTIELEARVSGLITHLDHAGAVIVPLVITPTTLEMRPGATKDLAIALFNPLLEDATFTLSGEDLPSRASLTINGFSDTVLLSLDGQDEDLKTAEIELDGGTASGEYEIRFTLTPTNGDETYWAVVTLTVLKGDEDEDDGFLPSLTIVGGLATVILVAVVARIGRRGA